MTSSFIHSAALLLLSIICVESSAEEGLVRLGGGNTDAGRVELFYRGKWGWICLQHRENDPTWGNMEAEVVCKQLGLRKGVGTMQMANAKWDDILPIAAAKCKGSESSFLDCHLHEGPANQSICQEADFPAAAGVRCTEFLPEEQPRVTLSNPVDTNELLQNSSYRLACDPDPVTSTTDPVTSTASTDVEEHRVTTPLPEFSCNVTVNHAKVPEKCNEPAEVLPEPFSAGSAHRAFVFSKSMEGTLLSSERQRTTARSAHTTQVSLLQQSGVRWTPLGLDLRCMVQSRSLACHNSTIWTVSIADLVSVRHMYLSPVARLLFDLDADIFGLTGRRMSTVAEAKLDPRATSIFETLDAHGVVKLGDMNLSEELQAEALAALGDLATANYLAAVRSPLPLLEAWLQSNTTLKHAVAAYFGGHAMLHGYKVVHLPNTMSTKTFVASHWHHDRTGRRLKLFMLLNDVDSTEGHPTQVAKGSHHLAYYWHEEFEQSRYTDKYVKETYETVRLSGLRGSGYLFDTNTIHKGTPEGTEGRNVIVVEFHQAAKCGLIARLGLNIPCPSGDQKPLNWYFKLPSGASPS